MTEAQRRVLRFGAVMLLLGAVVTAFLTFTIDSSSPQGDEVTVVDDPSAIALPAPGLFGGETIVYGALDESAGATIRPADLGCRLLDDDGDEQSSAKMSGLAVLGESPVEVDGEQLEPLFTVGSYDDGASVECSDAASVAPIAVSAASTFGTAGGLVRGFTGALTVLLLLLGVAGLILLRPRR